MDNPNTFIISDTHFWHQNIIDYEDRPFDTVEEMNKYMVKQWNSVVGKDDLIYHLGDVSLGKKEETRHILSQLNGIKILILGNHDHFSITAYREMGFWKVYDQTIIIDDFVILSHKPLYLRKIGPFVNICGHTHGKSLDHKDYFNVSVETNDYKPYNLTHIYQQVAENRHLDFSMELSNKDRHE